MSGICTLGEGNTPLVRSAQVGPRHGAPKLWFKLESCNPSGSYKDRFIAAEMSRIVESGAQACVATSSGNTGSSLAAYCARYGVRCMILVNYDAPAGKLTQMQAHGAKVIRIREFVSDPRITSQVFEMLRAFSRERNAPLVVSAYRYCPNGMAAVEKIAQELREQFAHERIDHVFVPVGGGGLFSAVARGFAAGGVPTPRIHAVQPAGCLTVVASYLRNDDEINPVNSTTRISGLSVPSDIDASLALSLLRGCGGMGFAVNDEEVRDAQNLLLSHEGIYAEPAGSAALAGWLQAVARGVVKPADRSVCLVTGHGFKDPASAEAAAARHPGLSAPPAELQALLQHLLEETS